MNRVATHFVYSPHRRTAGRLRFERQALRGTVPFKLADDGEFDSVSELTESLAAERNEEYTDSVRSKVIYNVDRPGPGGKGSIEREERGSYRTRLSHIGELWVRAHSGGE